MKIDDLTPFVFAHANAQRLALLALFDAMGEMVGSDVDEFRLRFMRHLAGRASVVPEHHEARLLRELAAQVADEHQLDTTRDTPRSRPS